MLPNTEIESWKTHPVYLNYEASTLGRIRHVKHRRFLKPFPVGAKRNYFNISISHNGKRKDLKAHRFVAEVFLGDAENYLVDHIDGCVTNNCITNLRLVTAKGNGNNLHKAKGVYKIRGKWRARFRADDNLMHLGYFETEDAAREAYREAVNKRTLQLLESGDIIQNPYLN